MFALSVAAFWLIDWLLGGNVYQRMFYPAFNTTADARAWSSISYTVMFVIGLPVAFLLWHWRDVNVREQIDNARKDINLKEFQEVQLRAAGALDEKLPAEAREQLQIAALHQLRGFLRGDYGEAFKLPAFELLMAGHAAAVVRIGVPEVQEQITRKSRKEINEAANILISRLTPTDRTRMDIIRGESEHIFILQYPLNHRRFDLLELVDLKFPCGLELIGSYFFKTVFFESKLIGVDFSFTNLDAAEFVSADLQLAKFDDATICGALFADASLEGASFILTTYDDSTAMSLNWDKLPREKRNQKMSKLLELGAIHVDEPHPLRYR